MRELIVANSRYVSYVFHMINRQNPKIANYYKMNTMKGMAAPSTKNLNKSFMAQEVASALKGVNAPSMSMKMRKRDNPRISAKSAVFNPAGRKFTSDQIYPTLDPQFAITNTNYQFGLKSREEFHKFLDGTAFFDKISNVIAKLYQEEGEKAEDSLFYERNVAEYIHEQLGVELGGVPWKEQAEVARRKRDEVLARVEGLEKEKAKLMHYVETGERWLRRKVFLCPSAASVASGRSSARDLSTKGSRKRFKSKSRMLRLLKASPPSKQPSTAVWGQPRELSDNPPPMIASTGELNARNGSEEATKETKSAANLGEVGKQAKRKKKKNVNQKKPNTQ